MNTPNTLQGPYVFISYSHLDEAFAKHLAKDLNARGIQTWIDETGIKPGSPDWDSTLRQVIGGAFAFILIASPNISSSTYVKGEVAIAKAQSRDIYPVWAHGTGWVDCVPINLINMQYIEMRGQYYTVGLDKLVATITNVKSSQGSGGNDRARQQSAQSPQYTPRQQIYASPPPQYVHVSQPQYKVPVQPEKKRSATLWIILSIFIGALVVCSIFGLILSRTSNASFPSLKSKYAGELQNTTILTRANIAFTFQQSQGEISGVYTETNNAGTSSAPLTGTIDTSGNIKLVIQTSNSLSFAGSIQPDGTLSGTFTTNNSGGGTWSASPA
jgi:hypothetical protein